MPGRPSGAGHFFPKEPDPFQNDSRTRQHPNPRTQETRRGKRAVPRCSKRRQYEIPHFRRDPAGHAGRRFRRQRRRRVLAGTAHHAHRAFPGRGRHRHLRPSAGPAIDHPAGAVGGDRQQGGRGRHRGRRRGRQGPARRLHLLHGRRAPCAGAVAVQEPELQHPEGLRAGGAGGATAAGDRHQSRQAAGQDGAGIRRLRQEASRRNQLRHGRQGQHPSPGRRAVRDADRHQAGRCALPGGRGRCCRR